MEAVHSLECERQLVRWMNEGKMKLSDIEITHVGDTIQMVGALYHGEGQVFLCMFPDYLDISTNLADGTATLKHLDMDSEDWKTFLRQADIMETEVLVKAEDGKLVKAIMRKSQRQIDQTVAWNVFRRDKFTCRYCGKDNVPLTVDHLVRWEEGGPTIEANLLASCRRCNRTRGRMAYGDWMQSPEYLEISKNLDWGVNRDNHQIEHTLDAIPRVVHVKSR